MRNLPVAFAALAIAAGGCTNGGASGTVARNAPSLLVVPYFTVAGDVWSSKSVVVYKTDAATGNLRLVAGSPFAAGTDPTLAAFAQGGRFAYVINKGSGNVSGYSIDATTGALKPLRGSSFALDYSAFGPNGIVVDPAGRFAYVASDAGISALSIDAKTGVLARIPGSPFGRVQSDGFGTVSIAIAPSGRHAYGLNYFRNTVSAYTIDATGALALAGSPLDAGQNSNEPGESSSVTIDPKARFAYVTASCCLYVYAIDATSGALTHSMNRRGPRIREQLRVTLISEDHLGAAVLGDVSYFGLAGAVVHGNRDRADCACGEENLKRSRRVHAENPDARACGDAKARQHSSRLASAVAQVRVGQGGEPVVENDLLRHDRRRQVEQHGDVHYDSFVSGGD